MSIGVGVDAKLDVKLIRKSGEVVEIDPTVVITNVGYDKMCDCIANPTRPAPFTYVAIGTSSTAPSASDTVLGNEVARGQGSYSHTSGTKSFSVTYTFTFTASYTIWESGLFNASSGGAMLCRGVFDSGIPVASGDSLQVTWTITFS